MIGIPDANEARKLSERNVERERLRSRSEIQVTIMKMIENAVSQGRFRIHYTFDNETHSEAVEWIRKLLAEKGYDTSIEASDTLHQSDKELKLIVSWDKE